MRRSGNLMGQVVDANNLRAAFHRAAHGKWTRPGTQRFASRLEAELASIRNDLVAGVYTPGAPTVFVIHDPKERMISAAPFRDRVVHHALMGILGPIWERRLIHHTYACRTGRGSLAATHRAGQNSRQYGWFVKCDIRKYFDSIDHEVARRLIRRCVKDPRVLAVLDRILSAHESAPGCGVPIGSLISQHLANLYLEPLDRWVLAQGATRAYVRYMDDLVVWANDSKTVRDLGTGIESFAWAELKLNLKQRPICNRVSAGFDFLGCHISNRGVGLARRSRHRLQRQLSRLQVDWSEGRLGELALQQRATSLFAFALRGGSAAFRRRVLARVGPLPDGLEPRESRGQLEQQRQELPVGEPQQELALEPEQQPGLPGCLRPSSTRPDG